MAEPLGTTGATVQRQRDYDGGYVGLRVGPGEPHTVRAELGGAGTWTPRARLLSLLHITDFQLADLLSPSRTEFLQRFDGDPRWQRMLPAYRPQEFLQLQALVTVAATARAVAASHPVDLLVTTGDNTDSAQFNEVQAYLTALDGGPIDPAELGVAHPASPSGGTDPSYWHPRPGSSDAWAAKGLPEADGALEAARRRFPSPGVGVPWLSVYGNHDCLLQGRAPFPAGYDDFLTGAGKPVLPPADYLPERDSMLDYLADPWVTTTGVRAEIPADPGRRSLTKAEHVAAHFRPGAVPDGHGYTADNVAAGTAYYIWDGVPGVRLISLDTTNPAGDVNGCVDDAQFRWLEQRLAEVGEGSDDPRLVVLLSHHGLSTLDNPTGGDPSVHLADDVRALLHRYPQAVLWLSGHIHVNTVVPRPGPDGGGFWEVTTSAVAEWPVQLRHVALELAAEGAVITVTMIDSAAPVDWQLNSVEGLAGLHREVAANDPGSVGGIHAEGGAEDRNVVLRVPLPAGLTDALPVPGRD
ncbi:MAG: metallophosphoesterase [Micropruina sp.]|uniref:metallophosphoesterase n=1 Tax=Micropruina sp. TaxID=2737536 RepID=UPI0039E27966